MATPIAEPIRFCTLNNVAAIPIEAELILVKVENCTATTVRPKQKVVSPLSTAEA
ncbi:hypothetical protein [Bacillus sp. ISL-57]|uniref:hypothetical protein n=1 Tax=Bacillus sp. ISL-57 TaxID=2819135 RepID=UPI001BEA3994